MKLSEVYRAPHCTSSQRFSLVLSVQGKHFSVFQKILVKGHLAKALNGAASTKKKLQQITLCQLNQLVTAGGNGQTEDVHKSGLGLV